MIPGHGTAHALRSRRHLGVAVLLSLVPALFLAAPARSAEPAWVRLLAPTKARERPGPREPPMLALPVLDREGGAIAVPVLRVATRSGQEWLKIRFGGDVGWIPADVTAADEPAELPLALRERLAALFDRAGGHAGAVIADNSGRPLFARAPQTPRILASNTKLFTTGAAVAAFGSRIGGLLDRILRPSNNRLAQRLLNRLGRVGASTGPLLAEAFARNQGSRVTIADGSGLSRANRAAPGDVVRFLVGMRRQLAFATWLDALPVAGFTGTLAGRMRNTAAERVCQAKTGTLHDVSALSGYCTTVSGHRVVFSFLMNAIDPVAGRAIQDRMLAALVALG